MSNELATTDKSKTMTAVLERMKPELAKALGSQVPVDFFTRTALTAMRKNPLLFQCTQESMLQCFMDLAQIRLIPDSITGEAYLIPFKNGQKYECQLMIGYQGYLKMMRRSASVTNVYASAVFDADEFSISFGSSRHMTHKPNLKGPRGVMIGAVAYVSYDKNGVQGEDFVWVDADYIERVKKSARGSGNAASPWVQWPEAMWAKTALKQLAKTADLSPDVREAVSRAADMEGAIEVQATVQPQQSTIAPDPQPTRRRKKDQEPEPEPKPEQPEPSGEESQPEDGGLFN